MDLIDKYSQHTYSYLALRKAVGWIGVLLPFVLMFGVLLTNKGEIIQESVSHYYYTNMRNVFVGAICAIALFLFFYSGYNKWDDWAGNLAGLFAVGVSWFPTTDVGPTTLIGKIHFICATLFFLILATFSLFLFTKKSMNPTPRKLTRNKIYIICGIAMIACLITILIYYNFTYDDESKSCFVFWAETIALIAFGISWLIKGGTLYKDK
jgi:Mn2+/Fe2+ NRAMP family transporter